MSKFEKVVIVLLAATTVFSGVTAFSIAKMVRQGFEVDLTLEKEEAIDTPVSDELAKDSDDSATK